MYIRPLQMLLHCIYSIWHRAAAYYSSLNLSNWSKDLKSWLGLGSVICLHKKDIHNSRSDSDATTQNQTSPKTSWIIFIIISVCCCRYPSNRFGVIDSNRCLIADDHRATRSAGVIFIEFIGQKECKFQRSSDCNFSTNVQLFLTDFVG